MLFYVLAEIYSPHYICDDSIKRTGSGKNGTPGLKTFAYKQTIVLTSITTVWLQCSKINLRDNQRNSTGSFDTERGRIVRNAKCVTPEWWRSMLSVDNGVPTS